MNDPDGAIRLGRRVLWWSAARETWMRADTTYVFGILPVLPVNYSEIRDRVTTGGVATSGNIRPAPASSVVCSPGVEPATEPAETLNK